MPKYLFTSDQRISDLSNRIKAVAQFVNSGHNVSEITDKSENNNATTLKFYYNLHNGTDTCKNAEIQPLSAIRNFVLKFQFPNTRTSESFNDSMNEKTLFAPFRSVVKVLYKMAITSHTQSATISLDEILFYFFCNPAVYRNPLFNIDSIIKQIINGRNASLNLQKHIIANIEWNQYGRQSQELFKVLTYASSCFSLNQKKLSLSLNNTHFLNDKSYIEEIINYPWYWYPSNVKDFDLSNSEYISYMNTNPSTTYNVINLNQVSTPANLSKEALQQIFYGSPGTGKSHKIKEKTRGRSVIRTTFHPDSDYSSFVGAYKPTMGNGKVYGAQGPLKDGGKDIEEPRIIYKFVPQAFLKAYLGAWKKMTSTNNNIEPQFLIIEEINRGNCAQIFGDLFQLLDRGNNGFSEYPIEADTDLQKEIEKAFKEDDDYKLNIDINVECMVKDYISNYGATLSEDIQHGRVLLLPPNLYIWATMNTSDQSLFPIDSAFKRRWEWNYMKIHKGKDDLGNDLNWEIIVKDDKGNNLMINNKTSLSWWDFIQKINVIIASMTSSADKQLGFFFCKADQNNIIEADVFVSKVIFYLWNDVFKDYGFEDSSLFQLKETINGKEELKTLTFPDFYNDDGDAINGIRLKGFLESVMNWEEKKKDEND